MNHDPLCPYFPEQQGFGGIDSGVPSTQPYIAGIPCQCALIARVREDERMTFQFVKDIRAAALRDAVEAIRTNFGTDEYGDCDIEFQAAIRVIEALGGER